MSSVREEFFVGIITDTIGLNIKEIIPSKVKICGDNSQMMPSFK